MVRTAGLERGLSPARRRRVLQIIFIFVNLALVEVHLPGPLWLAIGGIFWVALVGISVAGSNLVCGTMCWIGAIQDIFEPFARPRIRIDARFGRGLVLAILVLWMPIGWLVLPGLAAHDRVPINVSFGWERYLFQCSLAAGTAASVVFLGKRGLCRFFCPFNSIVASVRHAIAGTRAPRASSEMSMPCATGCTGCSRTAHAVPVTPLERSTIT